VADSGNARVEEFDLNRAFIRAYGILIDGL